MREVWPASQRVGLLTLMSAAFLLLSGCVGGRSVIADPSADQRVPPDFSLAFCVVGSPGAAEPWRRSAVYLVEPDRTLRAATGPGSTLSTYPRPTAALTRGQVAEVYRLVRAAQLDQPNQAGGRDVQPPCYRVVVMADGVRIRRDVPIAGSPTAMELADTLAKLSGLR